VFGLSISIYTYRKEGGAARARSEISFNFNNAESGMTPSGYYYDVNWIKKEEVLSAALVSAKMDEKYTTEQIRRNIRIIETDSTMRSASQSQTQKKNGSTHFTVELLNEFDERIYPEDLTWLLNKIMEEYRKYMIQQSLVVLPDHTALDNMDQYDYPQQVKILKRVLKKDIEYAKELSGKYSSFSLDGKGFNIIVLAYEDLLNGDYKRLEQLVNTKAVTKDPARLENQYEENIKALELQIQETEKEKQKIDALAAEYQKGDIVYISTTRSLQQVASDDTDIYNVLIAKSLELTEEISSLNEELEETKQNLNDAREVTVSGDVEFLGIDEAEAIAKRDDYREESERGIASLVNSIKTITDELGNILQACYEKEMNQESVSITTALYDSPSLFSLGFARKFIGIAGSLCAMSVLAGLIITLIIKIKKTH
jgi:hypothetical protein